MATQNFQENKKIARTFFESFSKGDYAGVEKLLDKSYKLHIPVKSTPQNVNDSISLMKEYKEGFKDLSFKIENQIAEGDMVITRFSVSGTHNGTFQGIKPTNKKINVTGIASHKIVNGKITEEWTEFDALGMMTQLGVVPEPAHQV